MLIDVTQRLASFGYVVTEADSWVLDFIIQKITNSIKADCGVYDSTTSSIVIPDGLHEIAVDMVVGEFLLWKKTNNQLTGFDLSAAVKQIQEGDTSVVFAVGEDSPDKKLNGLISYLLEHGKGELASYRCFKW
jgi:hypothetical protein